jgi:hypothetical protein
MRTEEPEMGFHRLHFHPQNFGFFTQTWFEAIFAPL